MVFWVVTPRSDVVGYRRLGGPCCLKLESIYSLNNSSFRIFRNKSANKTPTSNYCSIQEAASYNPGADINKGDQVIAVQPPLERNKCHC